MRSPLVATLWFSGALALTMPVLPALAQTPVAFPASRDANRLPPLGGRPASVGDLDRAFEAFAIAISGYWLSEDLGWFVFASYDPETRTLRWESSVPASPFRDRFYTTVQHAAGATRLRGTEFVSGSRARADFFLTDNTTLHSDFRAFGVPRHLGFRLLDQNRLGLYNGAEGQLQYELHRVLPGDPDGRLARAWASGGAQWSDAIREVNAAERARQQSGGASELFALLGAVAGGVIAGSQSDGDMTAISAGMAAGSSMASPNSEIASAANTNLQAERQRYEAEREQERQTIAAINDPNGVSPAVSGAPSASASPQRPAARTSNANGTGLERRTVQAYFAWGMALGPTNTRNPRCFSNIFSITYQSAPNGFGDAGRAEAEAGQLASVFRQKCERLGRMDPGTPLPFIGLPGVPFSAPYITAEDYQVTLP
jgi:hypothetical protein